MKQINLKKQINSTLNESIEKISNALKTEGFGILTRIDLHTKLKEKINKDIKPTIILGVCNPSFAFEALQVNPEVTNLLPCNVVIREIKENTLSIEFAKPTSIINVLDDPKLSAMALEAEAKLKNVLDSI